ncbi:uncharacterized protein LOC141911015 isoform X2 [Tubulanus polymorphus]|uniref:uncharacterized protein LOC141911015 isoform X2 n=1 Tax=Tubulanus polymorphus TaxID=672921 RepID=UPI003DA68D7F
MFSGLKKVLKNVSSSGSYAGLSLMIFQHKLVIDNLEKLGSLQKEAIESEIKWAITEENIVLRELILKLNEMNLMVMNIWQEYVSQYKIYRSVFQSIHERRGKLNESRKQLGLGEIRKEKARKHLENISKKNDVQKTENAKQELNTVTDQHKRIKTQVKMEQDELEKFTVLNVRDALMNWSSACHAFHKKSSCANRTRVQIVECFLPGLKSVEDPVNITIAQVNSALAIRKLSDKLKVPMVLTPKDKDAGASFQAFQYISGKELALVEFSHENRNAKSRSVSVGVAEEHNHRRQISLPSDTKQQSNTLDNNNHRSKPLPLPRPAWSMENLAAPPSSSAVADRFLKQRRSGSNDNSLPTRFTDSHYRARSSSYGATQFNDNNLNKPKSSGLKISSHARSMENLERGSSSVCSDEDVSSVHDYLPILPELPKKTDELNADDNNRNQSTTDRSTPSSSELSFNFENVERRRAQSTSDLLGGNSMDRSQSTSDLLGGDSVDRSQSTSDPLRDSDGFSLSYERIWKTGLGSC